MDNFSVLQAIDGILGRLTAVRPEWKHRHGGPRQWCYIAEPKNSCESELARHTTALSAPDFPASEKPVVVQPDVKPGLYDEEFPPGNYWEVMGPGGVPTLTPNPPPPRSTTGRLLPRPKPGQEVYSVDWRMNQVLHGLRAYLLVLIDASGACARDEDYVQRLPASDSFSVVQHMRSWTLEDFVPNAKYWKDWPLARFLRNPLPPRPASWTAGHTSPLFSGETGRFVHRLATYDTDRPDADFYFRAVFGISQCKRGFAEVPPSFVKSALLKHSRQLSTPPGDWDSEIEDRVLAFGRRLFRDFRPPSDLLAAASLLEGTPKASAESSRQFGGSREHLLDLAALSQSLARGFARDDQELRDLLERRYPRASESMDLEEDSDEEEAEAEDPLQAHHLPQLPHLGREAWGEDLLLSMREVAPGVVVEDRGGPPLDRDALLRLTEIWTPDVQRHFLPQNSEKLVWELEKVDRVATSLPVARVAAVLEPLKVRTITAMDGLLTYLAHPLQRSLWRYLRSFPCFRLIGETISEDAIHQLVESHRRFGGSPDDSFVSGDYSAATDGLNIHFSKALWDTLEERLEAEGYTPRECALLRSVLMEQVLVYPKGFRLPATRQRTGQLMGSILSFPFLCAANLFAYMDARPDFHQLLQDPKAIYRLPVLINGDDILFRTSPSDYERWKTSVARVGFSLSVGKNFIHRRFFTVNSVPITYRRAPTPTEFWRGWSWADAEDSGLPFFVSQVPEIKILGYLNVGLLTGQAKLTGRESLSALPLSGWYSGSVHGAMRPHQAHRWFLRYHLSEIRRQTQFGRVTLNIFAHPLLGGLGFPVPPGVEPRFSPEQRALARSLYLSALRTFEGQESEYELDSLVVLESDKAPVPLLGNIPRRVTVELYPEGSPLPEGYEPFQDRSGIYPLPMTRSWVVERESPDPSPRSALCRLPLSTLRKLASRYRNVGLHPVEEMTSFPFIPVRVSRRTADPVYEGKRRPGGRGIKRRVVDYVPRALVPVYIPPCPLQDVPPPEPWIPPFHDSSDEELIPPKSLVEDWESADVELILRDRLDVGGVIPPPAGQLTRSPSPPPRPAPSRGLTRRREAASFRAQFGGSLPKERTSSWSRKGGWRW